MTAIEASEPPSALEGPVLKGLLGGGDEGDDTASEAGGDATSKKKKPRRNRIKGEFNSSGPVFDSLLDAEKFAARQVKEANLEFAYNEPTLPDLWVYAT